MPNFSSIIKNGRNLIRARQFFLERGFYEQQCAREKWAVGELQRQIKSSLFLRLAAERHTRFPPVVSVIRKFRITADAGKPNETDHVLANPPFNHSDAVLRACAFPRSGATMQLVSAAKDHFRKDDDVRWQPSGAKNNMVALTGQLFYSTRIPVCFWFYVKNESAVQCLALSGLQPALAA
jgi:hypothetical protein